MFIDSPSICPLYLPASLKTSDQGCQLKRTEPRRVVENRVTQDEFVRAGHFEERLEFTRYRLWRAYERVGEHMMYGFDRRLARNGFEIVYWLRSGDWIAAKTGESH